MLGADGAAGHVAQGMAVHVDHAETGGLQAGVDAEDAHERKRKGLKPGKESRKRREAMPKSRAIAGRIRRFEQRDRRAPRGVRPTRKRM
jgi:hypothetical protein